LLMWYMAVVPAAIKGLGVRAVEHGRKRETNSPFLRYTLITSSCRSVACEHWVFASSSLFPAVRKASRLRQGKRMAQESAAEWLNLGGRRRLGCRVGLFAIPYAGHIPVSTDTYRHSRRSDHLQLLQLPRNSSGLELGYATSSSVGGVLSLMGGCLPLRCEDEPVVSDRDANERCNTGVVERTLPPSCSRCHSCKQHGCCLIMTTRVLMVR
jgi:hypothetical protein